MLQMIRVYIVTSSDMTVTGNALSPPTGTFFLRWNTARQNKSITV